MPTINKRGIDTIMSVSYTHLDVYKRQYHHYKEDIDMMAAGKQNTYRFSIAWDRILPNGRGDVYKRQAKTGWRC